MIKKMTRKQYQAAYRIARIIKAAGGIAAYEKTFGEYYRETFVANGFTYQQAREMMEHVS